MIPIVRSLLLSTALLVGASPSWAAREFTPQAGLWMIPSEIDGKPGRGFSLDVQGNTAFLQIFNYEKSGAATFHTAVGKLDEQASMTVPLQRFKGGRYFGGPAQDAVSDGSVGSVTVKFSDGLNGTVQFPGESEQPVARFLVPEKLPLWWTQLSGKPSADKGGFTSMHWTATSKNGVNYVWEAKLGADNNGVYPLELLAQAAGSMALRTFTCQLENATRVFDCLPTANSTNGEAANLALEIQRLRFRVIGFDVVGEIQPAWDLSQRMTLNGRNAGSANCSPPSCSNSDKGRAQIYVNSQLITGPCLLGSCFSSMKPMMLPTSGAWIIEDENTGKPGRGVFLDVQDDTIIVQTSDYLDTGEPTFHMGVANLKLDDPLAHLPFAISEMSMLRYADGRYFGSPALSGHEAANAGALHLKFSLKGFGVGDIQLPGEHGMKPIRRLALEASSGTPSNPYRSFTSTRDQHGNWLGLGKVNLPGLSWD